MNNQKIVCALVLAAMAMTGRMAGQSDPQMAGATKQAAKNEPNQVQTIVLPQYPGEITQGPNVQVYEKNCLICHSARYVSMQPRFPKTVWQSEVKKMVASYGASISEADQVLIVEYLVAVRGAKAPASPVAPTK